MEELLEHRIFLRGIKGERGISFDKYKRGINVKKRVFVSVLVKNGKKLIYTKNQLHKK